MIDAITFLHKIFKNLETLDIDLKSWEIDHLCYRTSSEQNYIETKERFQGLGKLLIESEINGRLIATYKLHTPIVFEKWIIDLVEVPAPKPNKETKEGFEHIEVVIDISFDEFIKDHPKVTFHKQGLQKDLNPELEIEFEDCAIKFHHKSLEHIINIEKNPRVMGFLQESQILSHLKEYKPCLSGTLPLGIQTPVSDLDILFSSNNFGSFLKDVKTLFGEEKNFTHKERLHQDLPSLIINFEYNDLPVELFCQNQSVFKQQANQHFLIEGRLLKLLGDEFFQKVSQLKASGIKTEPAFGQLLGLKYPYQDLLKLNQLSDSELLSQLKSIT